MLSNGLKNKSSFDIPDRASEIIGRVVVAFAALQFSPSYTRAEVFTDQTETIVSAGKTSLNALATALIANPSQVVLHEDLNKIIGNPVLCRGMLKEFGCVISNKAADKEHREKVLATVDRLAEIHPKEILNAQIYLTAFDGSISDATYKTVMERVAGVLGAKVVAKEIVGFWEEEQRSRPGTASEKVLPSLIDLLVVAVPTGECILKKQILEIAPDLPPVLRRKFILATTLRFSLRNNDVASSQLSAAAKELLKRAETDPVALEILDSLLDSLNESVGSIVLDTASPPEPSIALSLVSRVDRLTVCDYAARSPLKAAELLPYIDRHILRAVQANILSAGIEPAKQKLFEFVLRSPAETAYFGDFKLLGAAARNFPEGAKKAVECLSSLQPTDDAVVEEIKWLNDRLLFPEESIVRSRIRTSYAQSRFLIQCELVAGEVFQRLFGDGSEIPKLEEIRAACASMSVFERHALAERIAARPELSKHLFAIPELLSETAHGEEILISVAKLHPSSEYTGELSSTHIGRNLNEIGRAYVLATRLSGDRNNDVALLEAESPCVIARCLLALAESVSEKEERVGLNPCLSLKTLGSLICAEANRISLSPAAYEVFMLAALYAEEDDLLQAMPAMRTNEGRVEIAVSMVERIAQNDINRALEMVPKLVKGMGIIDASVLYASVISANRLLIQGSTLNSEKNNRTSLGISDEQLRERIPKNDYEGALECYYRKNPDAAAADAKSLVLHDRGVQILLQVIRSPGQRVLDTKVVIELIKKNQDIDAARPLFQYLFLDAWEPRFAAINDEDELLRKEFPPEFAAYGIALRNGLRAEVRALENNRRLAWEFAGIDSNPQYRLMYHQDPALSLLPGVIREWLQPIDAGWFQEATSEQVFERRLLIARELYRFGMRDFRDVTLESIRKAETSLFTNLDIPLVFKNRNILFLTNPEPAGAMFSVEPEFEVLEAERQMGTTNRFNLPGNEEFFRSEGAHSILEIHPYESDVSPAVARDTFLLQFVEIEPPFTFYAKLHGDPEALAPKGGHSTGVRDNCKIRAGLITADALAKAYVERMIRYPQLKRYPDIMINDACQGFLFWENFWSKVSELCTARGVTQIAPILCTGAERGQLGYSSRGTKGGSAVFDALMNIREYRVLDVRDLQHIRPRWGNPSLWIPAPDVKGRPRAGLRQISFEAISKHEYVT